MFRTFLLCLLLGVCACPLSAQKGPGASYGPVVSAYLINLEEELNELEFQLKHVEISQSDYSISKQRLQLQKQYVVKHVSATGEDLIPEMQILTSRELTTMLGFGESGGASLKVGELLSGKWEVVAIERRTEKFYVLSRRSRDVRGASRPRPDLNDVIETITVYEPDPEELRPVQKPAVRIAPAQQPVMAPEVPRPLIRSLYLPQYTRKARENRIEGKVIVSAIFTRQGIIREVSVDQKLGYGLDENALDAARELLFEPARVDGKAVDIRANIVYTFTLSHIIATIQPVAMVPEQASTAKGGQP